MVVTLAVCLSIKKAYPKKKVMINSPLNTNLFKGNLPLGDFKISTAKIANIIKANNVLFPFNIPVIIAAEYIKKLLDLVFLLNNLVIKIDTNETNPPILIIFLWYHNSGFVAKSLNF